MKKMTRTTRLPDFSAFTGPVASWITDDSPDEATEVMRFMAFSIPTMNAAALCRAMGVSSATMTLWLNQKSPLPVQRRRQALELLKRVVTAFDVARNRTLDDSLRVGRGTTARHLVAAGVVSAGEFLIEEEERRLSRIERDERGNPRAVA